LTYKS